jgi:hypothetical protein
MESYWCSRRRPPVAAWTARLDRSATSPDRLVDWAATVAETAERERLYVLEKSTLLGYDRARDGPLPAFLRRWYAERGEVNLFDFHRSPGDVILVSGDVTYADRDGHLVTRTVHTLADVEQELHPESTYDPPGGAPLGIYLEYGSPDGIARVVFSLTADLWFPWVQNWRDDNAGICPIWDNRRTAEANTGRLNAFLRDVAAATAALAGTVALYPEDTDKLLGTMLSDAGIDLTAPCQTALDPGFRARGLRARDLIVQAANAGASDTEAFRAFGSGQYWLSVLADDPRLGPLGPALGQAADDLERNGLVEAALLVDAVVTAVTGEAGLDATAIATVARELGHPLPS